MRKIFIVTGTDTGIGKTVAAAMLTLALDAFYWKPVQSGTIDGVDTQSVRELTQLSAARFLPERYVLSQPLSPHRAAELDGVDINLRQLDLPNTTGPLIIEGAGGLLVPLTRQKLTIDLFAAWRVPVILCARTGLGTINHTLLSVEALRQRRMPLHGIIFIGPDNPDNIKTIADFSGARVLGHIPPLDPVERTTLQQTFMRNFRKEDFI